MEFKIMHNFTALYNLKGPIKDNTLLDSEDLDSNHRYELWHDTLMAANGPLVGPNMP